MSVVYHRRTNVKVGQYWLSKAERKLARRTTNEMMVFADLAALAAENYPPPIEEETCRRLSSDSNESQRELHG